MLDPNIPAVSLSALRLHQGELEAQYMKKRRDFRIRVPLFCLLLLCLALNHGRSCCAWRDAVRLRRTGHLAWRRSLSVHWSEGWLLGSDFKEDTSLRQTLRPHKAKHNIGIAFLPFRLDGNVAPSEAY
eukprot:6752623-Prymnesium_polylepis.2